VSAGLSHASALGYRSSALRNDSATVNEEDVRRVFSIAARALRRPAVVGAALLIAGGCLLSVAPRSDAAVSSIDAATLGLLPFALTDAELPSGWTVSATLAATNAVVAFAAGSDAQATLARLQASGRVTGLQQTFLPPRGSAKPPAQLVIQLFRDAKTAADALTQIAPPDGAETVDDFSMPEIGGARALHAVSNGDAGKSDTYIIAWSGGSLLFGVTTSGPGADPEVARAIALTEAARHPSVPAATPDPATDARDLGIATALDAAQLPASAVPATFKRVGAYLWPDAQLDVDARAPDEAARRVADLWQRVTGEYQYFEAQDGTRTTLTASYALFSSNDAAEGALHDDALFLSVRQAIWTIPPPVQLGDSTVAFHEVILWPRGELRDGYVLQWRRGRLILSVTAIVPLQAPMPPYLASVAQAFDAAYLAAQPALP